jgi:adenylate kinase family enzyme
MVEIVTRLLQRDDWVIDGNYSGTLDMRLEACDTVIFLDLPRTICVWRALKRWFLYRKNARPDMAEGCHERFSLEFIGWVWNYSRTTRPGIMQKLKTESKTKQIVRLRSRSQVEKFLASVQHKVTASVPAVQCDEDRLSSADS